MSSVPKQSWSKLWESRHVPKVARNWAMALAPIGTISAAVVVIPRRGGLRTSHRLWAGPSRLGAQRGGGEAATPAPSPHRLISSKLFTKFHQKMK